MGSQRIFVRNEGKFRPFLVPRLDQDWLGKDQNGSVACAHLGVAIRHIGTEVSVSVTIPSKEEGPHCLQKAEIQKMIYRDISFKTYGF